MSDPIDMENIWGGSFKMDSNEFSLLRRQLDKTQRQMAQLLGTSIKAVHSYEQGWRKVPGHVERQMLFLICRKKERNENLRSCWTVKKCPPERRDNCPAWEFNAGKLCWFINGTICQGINHESWEQKMKICRSCEVLGSIIAEQREGEE